MVIIIPMIIVSVIIIVIAMIEFIAYIFKFSSLLCLSGSSFILFVNFDLQHKASKNDSVHL